MKRETPNEKTERLLTTVPRTFIIKIDNIWRVAQGVYLKPLKDPYFIKCIYQGTEFSLGPTDFIDYLGYDDKTIDSSIIKRNIDSLPKPPVRLETTAGVYFRGPRRTYTGPTHAFTYTPTSYITDIIEAVPAQNPPRSSNRPTMPRPAPVVPEEINQIPITIHVEGPAPTIQPNTIIVDTVDNHNMFREEDRRTDVAFREMAERVTVTAAHENDRDTLPNEVLRIIEALEDPELPPVNPLAGVDIE